MIIYIVVCECVWLMVGLPGLSKTEWTLGLGEAAHLLHIVHSICTGNSSHLHTDIPEDISRMEPRL